MLRQFPSVCRSVRQSVCRTRAVRHDGRTHQIGFSQRRMLLSTSALRRVLHCKNIRISADILWRVFHVLTEAVQYTFVSVNRRSNEVRARSTVLIQTYTEPVPLTCEKFTEGIRIFLQFMMAGRSAIAVCVSC